MKILAVGRPTSTQARDEIAHHAREELAALFELYADGDVREMYMLDGPGSVLVLEADSLDAAKAVIMRLPLAAHDIIDFELLELRPFSALKLLFAQDEPR